MSYVPDDWRTAAYQHVIVHRKAGILKKMLCCNCGLTGWTAQQLWNEHVRAETELQQWLTMIETSKAQRSAQSRQTRAQNLAKYEEFKKDQLQNSSPGSASFYQS